MQQTFNKGFLRPVLLVFMAVLLDGVFVAKATGHTVFNLQVVFLPLALPKEYDF
jgi:hypothetical protein